MAWCGAARGRGTPILPCRIGPVVGKEVGVTDGARTHNLLSHNQGLCLLSYGHHHSKRTSAGRKIVTQAQSRPIVPA